MTAVIVCALVLVIVNVAIASYAISDQVKMLAYVPVFVGAVAALGWVVTGFVEHMYYRSLLRRAEAD